MLTAEQTRNIEHYLKVKRMLKYVEKRIIEAANTERLSFIRLYGIEASIAVDLRNKLINQGFKVEVEVYDDDYDMVVTW